MAEAKITIKAEDLASAAFADVTQKLDQMAKGMATAGQQASASGQMISGMSAAGREAEAALAATSAQAQTGTGIFAQLGGEVGRITAGFVTAQAIIAAVKTGFSELTEFIGSSIHAWSEQEAATTKLTSALRQHGLATPAITKAYIDLSSEFQQHTVYADEVIQSNETLLTQVGNLMPSQMKGALQASMDLASGLGIDLQSATMLVAKAAAGHTETLGRYGVNVSAAALETRGFDAVLDAINRQFSGTASAQMETYAGQVAHISNMWGEFKERLGQAAVQSAAGKAVMIGLKDSTEELAKANGSLGSSIMALWIPTAQALMGFTDAIELTTQLRTNLNLLSKTPSPFEEPLKGLDPLAGMLARGRADMEAWAKSVDEAQKIAEAAAKAYAQVWGEIGQMGADWRETVARIRPETRGLADDLLAAGLSQEKVAIATKLTIEQVNALAEARKQATQDLKDQAAWEDELYHEHIVQIQFVAEIEKREHETHMRALNESNRETAASIAQTARLWSDHYDFLAGRSATSEQQQVILIRRQMADELALLKQGDANYQAHYTAIVVKAQDAMQRVRDQHNLTFQAVLKLNDDLTENWQQHFTQTLVSTGSFGKAFEGIWTTVKTDVENIFGSMLTSVIQGFLQPLLDNVRNVASSISSMLLNALTGSEPGGGGFGGFVSGGKSFTNPTSLLASALGSIFGGGGAVFSSIAASEAAGIAGATAAGLGVTAGGIAAGGLAGAATAGGLASTTIGTGMIGSVGSTSSMAGGTAGGSMLGSIAGFLATNPIGWAIDAGIGALALWNHFSGPDDKELAGRAAVAQWEDDVWAGLSDAQRREASSAGWANPKDAGAMIWMRQGYTNLHRPDPEKSAEAYMQNVWGAITKDRTGVISAIQDVQSFRFGGTVRGPSMDAPVAVVAHDGETFRTKAQEAALQSGTTALHEEIRGLRADLKDFFRFQPMLLKHAMRGA